jgi:hypothetical protein
MPPGAKLSSEAVGAIRRWIDLGAPWAGGVAKTEPNWEYKSEDVWEFQPLKHTAIPTGFDVEAIGTPVDAFILQMLKDKGLEPAPRTDRVTLLRQATFDLTRIAANPEEIDAFVNDPATDRQAFAESWIGCSPLHGMEALGTALARCRPLFGYRQLFQRFLARWRYRDM